MNAFLIQLVFVAVLILVVIMVVIRLGRLGGNAASAVKSMADPVPGTLLVTAISMPARNAVFQMTRLTGVISAEGVDAFDTAKEYMTTRKQFGSPLKDFQALQFRLADMATELEAARIFL